MSNTPPNLTDLSPDVQALFAAQAAELIELKRDVLGQSLTHAATHKRLKSKVETTQAALVEERTAHFLFIKSRDMIIADLRLQLDGHKKHRFGSRSESIDQLAMELILEEHEIAQAAEADEDTAPACEEAKEPRTPRKRKPFPKDLERVETRITPSDACTDCGGNFKELGADAMDELEYIPGHYIVNQIVLPASAVRPSCRHRCRVAPFPKVLLAPR